MANKKWTLTPTLLLVLVMIVVGFQNCGSPIPIEDETKTLSSTRRSSVPSTSGLVGPEPLPDLPQYTSSATPDATSSPLPSVTTVKATCNIVYGPGVEAAFGGQAVTESECVSRFDSFKSDSNFNLFRLTCIFGSKSCGNRAPMVSEKLSTCHVSYGPNVELSFSGTPVTRALCVARFGQFIANPAFDSMALRCTWDTESCGARSASSDIAHGKCFVKYGTESESSFTGQDVTRELCIARFNQFVNESAFDSLDLVCTWNGSNCGNRAAPVAVAPTPAAPSEPNLSCLINYGGNIEHSFGGQLVTRDLCVARFNQFRDHSAFNHLSLSCQFGAESCGLRAPVSSETEPFGPCEITYGGNVERSFDGQAVTMAFCQARFNQFVGNSAFNHLALSCRFNGSQICGERGAIQ